MIKAKQKGKLELYANANWGVEDILEGIDCEDEIKISREQAREFLEKDEDTISEQMTKAGWDAIELLLGNLRENRAEKEK